MRSRASLVWVVVRPACHRLLPFRFSACAFRPPAPPPKCCSICCVLMLPSVSPAGAFPIALSCAAVAVMAAPGSCPWAAVLLLS
eukprot:3868409-Prymnesium_polylepis.1